MFFFLFAQDLSLDRRLNISMRLIGGHEDFIRVVLPESRQVDQQTVFVRHGDLDLIDFEYRFERTLGHGVEGLLHGFAFVVGKRFEHRLADGCADGVEVKIAGEVAPLRANGGAEEAIFCLGQRGERVLDVAFEARVCRLE